MPPMNLRSQPLVWREYGTTRALRAPGLGAFRSSADRELNHATFQILRGQQPPRAPVASIDVTGAVFRIRRVLRALGTFVRLSPPG